MNRWRLLAVVPSLNRAGAEYSLLYASAELVRRGHDVEVCALHEPFDLQPDFEASGIPVRRITGRALDRVPNVSRLLREGSFDFVRTLMSEASMVTAATFPTAPDVPRVASYHHVDFDVYPADSLARRARRALYGMMMRRTVAAHVGISVAVARHHEHHLGLRHVDVIWNGFPLAELQRAADAGREGVRQALSLGDDFVIVCPARFASDKGHEYLLDAVARLQERRLRLLLYGAGPRESELRQLARERGLDPIVRFMGTVPQAELMPVVAAADVLVLPSPHGEGFGRVLVEAMSVGTPVVTPALAGALDFVEHGETGWLVEPRSGASIAAALEALRADRGLAAAMGRRARARVERDFDLRVCGDRWEALFDRVAWERGRR